MKIQYLLRHDPLGFWCLSINRRQGQYNSDRLHTPLVVPSYSPHSLPHFLSRPSLLQEGSEEDIISSSTGAARRYVRKREICRKAPHLGCHESWVTRVGSKKSPSARPNDDPRRGAAKKKKRRRSPMRAERREGQQKDPIAKEEEIFAGGLEVPFLEHGGAVFIGLRFGLLERSRNGSTALSRTTRTPASDYG
ncbi:hypothetical protein B296_00011156 [Ensete ventricosum]|uniref:Uncharacterized protein n=1 Tax=Ensete ventricosum TaxID=4639 RepID=A0A426YZL2_ENSVE|nr:hypothetical protein B296_00011156 [Ensete ventricosum]